MWTPAPAPPPTQFRKPKSEKHMRMQWEWIKSGNCDSGVWLECKCHHFPQHTWASQQSSLFQTFLNWPIYILYFWTFFWSNLSINIDQIPFLFSISKILQKCFPNPSVPSSFLEITSRRPHVSADCSVPNSPLAPCFE